MRTPANVAQMLTTDVGNRFIDLFDPGIWATWIAGLDRGFTFLLLLPFIVAIVGLWASSRDREEAERDARRTDERDP